MNLFADMRAVVICALDAMTLEGALPQGLGFEGVTAEPPRDAGHGDVATNAAMVLAKPAGLEARAIAADLAVHLMADPRVETASVAGPGFLNIRLKAEVWGDVLKSIRAQKAAYGKPQLGHSKRVNVEFVSANPVAPLSATHLRGAVFGDALASLLEFSGYEVTREYYINDAGAQVDVLARSVYQRYLEAHGHPAAYEDGSIITDDLVPIGAALKGKVGDAYIGLPEADWMPAVRDFGVAAMMKIIEHDLNTLGVEMDVFSSEKTLSEAGRIEAALAALDAKGLIYEGVLKPPEGTKPEGWTPRRQTLFKSTAHGDDTDRPVRKSDGSWTYFAPDMAYHFDKVARGFDALIDVFGSDHGGYVRRMKAVVSACSDAKMPFDIKLTQQVRVMKGGAPYASPDQIGAFAALRDFVALVGKDTARFHALSRRNDAVLELDVDAVRAQSLENPAFCVQYACARAYSAVQEAALPDPQAGLPALGAHEIAVIRSLADWPRVIESAARTHEPHRIALYLIDLASHYHTYWAQCSGVEASRSGQSDSEDTSETKIALAHAVSIVLCAGLSILGVKPVEEMR